MATMSSPKHSHVQAEGSGEYIAESERKSLLDPRQNRSKVNNTYLFIVVGIVLQAPLIMGMSIGYSSPALPKMTFLNAEQQTWFGSLLNVGAIVGGPLAGMLLQMVGRKISLMSSTLPMVTGWVLIGVSENEICLYLGRILTGVGCGMISLTVPNYISEVATPNLRGLLGSAFQAAVTIGILLVYGIGIPLSYYWLAITGAALTALLLVTSTIVPETPRFLLLSRRRYEATNVLSKLRGPEADLEGECREIEDGLDNSDTNFSWSEFLQPSLYKPLIISLVIMFVQQFSGINAVMFYTVSIFQTAAPSIDSNVATVIVGVVQVVFTIIAALCMDRLGRKVLLIIGALGMAVSCTTFGLYYQLTGAGKASVTAAPSHSGEVLSATTPGPDLAAELSWLSLVSIIVYIIFFALAWGPIPWLLMSEIFPSRAKGAASGIATAFNWTCSFIVTKEFVAMNDLLTPQGLFWFYGAVCLAGAIFVFLFVPETKGRSLEEIEAIFAGNRRRDRDV